MFKWNTFVLALGLALIVSNAEARPKGPDFGPPMRILIVRGEGPDCPSNCPEWISLEGAFVKETPALFRKALEQIGARKPQVLISSGGGMVDAAMEMGRLLRAKGLDVSVARTLFDAPAVETAAPEQTSKSALVVAKRGRPSAGGSFCASACTLLLAAGKARHVAPDARVGLHEMFIPEQDVTQHVRYFQTRTLTRDGKVISKETRTIAEKDLIRHISRHSTSAKDYRRVAAYLDEMGVPSAKVVALMHEASPEHVVWLSRKGLADTLLATDAQPPEAALGLAPKVVAPAPESAAPVPTRETSMPIAQPRRERPSALTLFASRFGLTIGQLGLLSVLMLAMVAAILSSFRRGAWLGGAAQRRNSPPLS
ncbi:hypothetical protein [Methylocystis sp.]|jgi:hypothetical protein|uniref:hypothetical protein n=1 Tax=Methylocystis sp. TaxID=1911079 RepID=UPI003DA3812E